MKVRTILPRISAVLIFIVSIADGEFVDENSSPDQLQMSLASFRSNDNRYVRIKRQFPTTTTPRPKKKRPSNIFSLISQLIAETRDDTSRAFGEIGVLVNSQFKEPAKPGAPSSTTTTTASPGGDGDNEVASTTEPYKITRQEFMGIIRSNFQGIVRLFGKEFRIALRDSGKNVVQFGKEFRESLRPYVT